MKNFYFVFLIFISSHLFAQEKLVIYNDTVNCDEYNEYETETGIKITIGCYWRIEEGFNRIYDTTGLLLMEGAAVKRFRLGFGYTFRPRNYTYNVGLWRFFCNGKLVAYKAYDKKGRELSEITFYDNKQIHKIIFSNKFKKGTLYSKTYFKDGREVKSMDDTIEYINFINSQENECFY